MHIQMTIENQDYTVDFMNAQLMTARKGPLNTPHRHPVFHFILITDGNGLFHVENRYFTAETGDLIIISPDELHYFTGNDNHPMTDLESTFSLLDRDGLPCTINFFELIERSHGITLPPTIKSGSLRIPEHLRPFLIECFQRIIAIQKLHVSMNYIRIMIFELIFQLAELIIRISDSAEIVSTEGTIDLTIAKVKQYIQSRIHSPIQLKDMARNVYISPNYLCRIFKQRTGLSPVQYLLQLRMEEAAKLLLYTDNSIASIAEQLGYKNTSYFARVFRSEMEVSPTEYRNQHRLLKGSHYNRLE